MNRINLICLGVKDMEESLSFYKKIGFKTKETGSNPPIVFFNNQGSKLELFPIEKLVLDINETNPPEIIKQGFGGITLACNMKSKEEVDSLFSLVEKAGGKIIKKPEWLKLWNGYSGYFMDPNGYYFEVAYGEDWEFDENNILIIEK